MIKRPTVVVPGRPGCVHFEVVVGMIGTCRTCGQVRDYRPCYETTVDREKRDIGRAVQKSGKWSNRTTRIKISSLKRGRM